MTTKDLARLTRNYLDELEYKHPFINSDKFIQNSNSKWACRELLRFIKESEGLPFTLTAQEILEQFIDKMKTYACMNSRNSLGFVIAAETGEYLLEQSWRLN